MQLDKVRATFLQVVHGAPPVFGSGNRNRTRKARLRSVEHWPRSKNPRPNHPSGFNLVPPILHNVQVAAHVADAGHAVGDKERQRNILRVREPVAERQVHMHVPQARYQVPSLAIYAVGVARILGGFARPHGVNAVALQHHRLIRLQLSRAYVHDGHVVQNQQVRRGRFLRPRRAICQQHES